MTSGDPVSLTLDRQREWDEAIRLHYYNQDNELLLHVFEGAPPPPGQLCEGEDSEFATPSSVWLLCVAHTQWLWLAFSIRIAT